MHEESRFSSGGVQCPLCRSHDLVERNGVVLCPAGDLRLDLRNEGLTLDHVRCVSVTSCLIHICAWCFKVMYEGHKLCAYALLKPCHRMHNSYACQSIVLARGTISFYQIISGKKLAMERQELCAPAQV